MQTAQYLPDVLCIYSGGLPKGGTRRPGAQEANFNLVRFIFSGSLTADYSDDKDFLNRGLTLAEYFVKIVKCYCFYGGLVLCTGQKEKSKSVH